MYLHVTPSLHGCTQYNIVSDKIYSKLLKELQLLINTFIYIYLELNIHVYLTYIFVAVSLF